MLDLEEALASEQVVARAMVVELDQPGVDTPVRLLGPPFKLSRTPAEPTRAPGPGLGEHTEEILRQTGYSESEIRMMLDGGVVAGPGVAQGSFLNG